MVDGDHILAIIASAMSRRGELVGNTVVATVMANLGFMIAMRKADITVVETGVGDRYVLEAMHANGYVLGGEQSGHVVLSEFATTGDGMLATFEGPAAAVLCTAMIRNAAIQEGLHIRAGIHVGEVHCVGDDVRGAAVHGAARVMGQAGPDEILVSETTRALAMASGLEFEDRGVHELKGLPGEWHLFAYVGN